MDAALSFKEKDSAGDRKGSETVLKLGKLLWRAVSHSVGFVLNPN